MNGLERRLRQVEGVADLTIELGDAGLEGIRVKVHEGSDESEVLEDIRRILVAYGLRSRQKDEPSGIPDLGDDGSVNGSSSGVTAARVRPTDQGLVVEVESGTHSVTETGERSPIGAAEAMVRAVAKLNGTPVPRRIALALDELDGERVITLLGRRGENAAASAAVASPTLAEGLLRASVELLQELDRADAAS